MTMLLMSDRTLARAPRSGIARYVRHVANAAATHYGADLAFCSGQRAVQAPARWIPVPSFPGSRRLHVEDVIESCAAAWLRPRLYFGTYYGATRTSADRVYTVYDVIHEMHPEPGLLYRRAMDEKRRCLEGAAALIAISHSTAHDVAQHYPNVDPAKITVIHLAVDESFFVPTKSQSIERPYFLYVGTRRGTKNFTRLIEAFALSGLATNFDLLVVSPSKSDELQEKSVRVRAAVHDSELVQLYANATALVFPSEYEGFGLPVLEAMAAGTLVATSNISSMPEVGGDVAFYYDPKNIESIASTMRTIAALSPADRAMRREQGIARARTFTWEKCEQQTIALLDRLLH